MNKIVLTALVFLTCLPFSLSSRGQQPEKGQSDWMERVKTEKVAFLTSAMDLTSAEAEKFWPVYNRAEQEKRQAMETMMKAYRSLDEAVKGNKDEEEISNLLDQYLNALQAGKDLNRKYAAVYRKILSAKKVAQLYIGEESFRRQQIHRLRRDRKN